jgi:hypothetical protein
MSILDGPFFKISCNNTECHSELRVSAKVGDSPRSMAARIRELLLEKGWTKDSQGMDRCSECSESPVPLAVQLEQLSSEGEEGMLEGRT